MIGTKYKNKTLVDIVQSSKDKIFNNAAQAWNPEFYWNCMCPPGSSKPSKNCEEILKKNFGSIKEFQDKFTESALGLFGSGWTWLIKNKNKLVIENMSDANTPIKDGRTPILVCDVWEHAYYIDHHNERAKYLKNFWKVVNWGFIEQNYEVS